MSRGIFRLKQVYEEQLSGQWSTRGDVWLPPNPFSGKYNFSYVSGGLNNDSPGGSGNTGYHQRIEKYDFASDTTSLLTNDADLDHANNDVLGRANISSPENHYTVGGGNYYLYTSSRGLFKTSYANGTSRSFFLGDGSRSFLGGTVNNTSHGYYTLGATGYQTSNNTTTNYRIDFSNDYAVVVEKGKLIQARKSLAGVGNQNYGYFGGGKSGNSTERLTGLSGYSTVERLDYSSDSTDMSFKGPLSGARGYVAAIGNASYGYFAGGGSDVNSNVSTIDRIDYASDTSTASPKGPMTDVLWGISASGTPSYGYIYGGLGNQSLPFGFVPGSTPANVWKDAATNAKSYVQRIDFSNDTVTLSPRGNLQRKLYMTGSTSSQSNANTTPVTLGPNDVRENVTPQGTDFGYFAGGNNASLVHRVDYTNDTATASTKGPLSSDTSAAGATGNASFGYVGGGESPTKSTVDRIDYFNDTATAAVKGPLSLARLYLAATGNSSFGYFGGGFPGPYSTIDRVDYSNDTATAVARGPLSSTRYYLAATGNANFGYFGGGNPSVQSTVRRVDYSNDTVTTPEKGPLSLARGRLAATGNSSFGYFGGGFPGPTRSTVDRIDYSNDTATAPAKGPLSVTRERLSATGNADFGYFSGGQNPSQLSTIDRVDYSNDTATASPKGPLTVTRTLQAASSSRANAIPLKGPGVLEVPVSFGAFSLPASQGTDFGYFGGGFPGLASTVDRINYNNDTATASPKGPLSAAKQYLSATGNANFGYHGGGTSPDKSTVDRIDYSNDTATASPKGPLSEARYHLAATGNSSFGYFAGGAPGAPFSTIDRVDYANDTATAAVKGPLSSNRRSMAGTGNASFGYFGGGWNIDSRVDRVDYSNDTATASPKGPLNDGRGVLGATGNSSFGYFGGGFGPKSTVDRVDYSNDTATASTKGPLSVARRDVAATGNADFGYWGGGEGPSPTMSTIDRVDYSNDTATAPSKGPLSSIRKRISASSSRANAIPTTDTVNYAAGTLATPNTGYFGGGQPGSKSTVDRVDYSNDTPTATAKGPLSLARTILAATGNSSFGYFAGGNPGPVSTVDKIDYSNDTATAVAKGPLSQAKRFLAATGNSSFGYFGGGTPGPLSTVDRIDYSNDTGTAPAKGPLSLARYSIAATGNADFGYFGGGLPGPKSTVDRIDYSSDTETALPKGPLSSTRYALAATGNSSFGYFGGGNPGTRSTVDRIDYSNDTGTAPAKGPLSLARSYLAATGNSSFGYFAGGTSPGSGSTVDRIDYTNDTATATAKGPLSLARHNLAASSARANGFSALGPATIINEVSIPPSAVTPQNYGYAVGSNKIVRWSFSNDNDVGVFVNTNPSYNMSDSMAATVTSTTHAYWNRQYANSPEIHRLDYANDTANPVQVGSLISNKSSAAGVHNADYGYWCGGLEYPGGSSFSATSSVQRLDFSNDTANAVSKGNLSHAKKNFRGVGNMNNGYLIGSGTLLTKIDFSNDTATSTSIGTGGPQGGNYIVQGSGNLDYGWLSGYGGPNPYSAVLRLDYANDTGGLSPRGPLMIPPYSSSNGATGNRHQGYVHGGFQNGAIKSIMNKIVYANDTVTAQFKKTLFLCPGYTFYGGNSFSSVQNGLPQ